ncbi:hypothetical protein [Crenobacter cavernae]|uniref:hypothetical protein n=1 Tax=Crenobacter cavernae TaxID=2290923 RepID=UPI001F0C9606|nr:hypothetical protein [Crenobacter cavernae]
MFLTHAVAVLETLGAAGRAEGPQEAPSLATLSVGALPTVALDLLPLALGVFREVFREAYPNTRVVVQTGPMRRCWPCSRPARSTSRSDGWPTRR